jgi:ADP-ribose pyrophosphatase YjhB (NUDIX family)
MKMYLSTLIKNMTLKEQAGIACDAFESLWRQLWGDDRSSSDFAPSREKFNQLDRVRLMRQNLSEYTEPEWGFPKGRRMRGETDMACAVREFGEETNIPRDAYTVLKNIMFEETFTGLNNVRYRHVYFVALLDTARPCEPRSALHSHATERNLRNCVEDVRRSGCSRPPSPCRATGYADTSSG